MNQRKFGSQVLLASELGLGCMGMSEFYGSRDDNESIATIHRAVELGIGGAIRVFAVEPRYRGRGETGCRIDFSIAVRRECRWGSSAQLAPGHFEIW
jgi:hypothetical protein